MTPVPILPNYKPSSATTQLLITAYASEEVYKDPHFMVLDSVETLPGTYMYKDGQLVPYGAPYPSTAVIFQRLTLRECKALIDKYDEI